MPLIEIEKKELENGYILEIYLNNPQTRNSMTWEMGEIFQTEIEKISKEKELPRVVLLSGRNDVFCAGGDLNLLRSFSTKTFEENCIGMKTFYNFFLSIRRLKCPVICAAPGHAIGAGLSLAFAADIRVFADEGKYSFNFVKLGIHPGMGSSYTAVELLGKSRANQLLFLGEVLDGKKSQEWGVSSFSVPKDQVIAKGREIAESLALSAPLALQELKSNIYDDELLQIALKKESESQARNFISDDFKETIQSILEKRAPVFKGS
ncbi:MAG: enoyl-CoA hydratase/isomerase family protein [Leptospira sp.]|nr:enoyl-CoA hydratase/isomerase family protein [Leptospira sp.]